MEFKIGTQDIHPKFYDIQTNPDWCVSSERKLLY